MFVNNKKNASMIVNKPYFKRDLRVGEDAIVSAPIFQEHSLNMYADVPLIDLCFRDKSTNLLHPATDCDRFRVDYLICKGKDVIMAIDVIDTNPLADSKVRVPYLYYAETTAVEMEQGEVDDIVEMLEELLGGNFLPHWHCSMQEFSDELWDQLIDARLMEEHGRELLPTEYGNSEGLVTIICKQDSMEEVGRSTQYSTRVWNKLLGMFCDREDYKGVRFLKKLGDMPLEVYAKDYPQLLEQLKTLLPDSCRTYAQAAEVVHDALHDPNGDNAGKGTMMMDILTLPLFNKAMALTGECDALLRTGMSEFTRRLTVQSEPERQAATREEFERRLQEWDKRKDALKKEDSFLWTLLTLCVDDFFKGVGICTRLNYPYWLADAISRYHDSVLDRASSYAEALCWAYEIATSATLNREDGIRLLYQLTIEPFHLINQKARAEERLCGD